MKIGSIVIGMMLLISAGSEYYFAPIMLDKMNNLTNNLETSMIPTSLASSNNAEYQQMNEVLKNANSQANQVTSSFTGIEIKMINYTVYGSILIGIIFIAYGSLSKNKNQIIIKSTEALDFLKMRLAKGEITEKEFDSLKHHIR
jgi:hypothetical protein